MIGSENASELTGADEVDSLILLGMQKSAQAFAQTAGGAGIPGKCLACIARQADDSGNEGGYHGNEGAEP